MEMIKETKIAYSVYLDLFMWIIVMLQYCSRPLETSEHRTPLSEYIQMNLHLRVKSHGEANEMNTIILPECTPILACKGTSGR